MGLPVLIVVLPIVCYLVWLFVKLQRLSRRQRRLRNRLIARGAGGSVQRTRQKHHRKE